MLATKIICPHCSKHLKTSKPLTVGHRVLCSRCGRSFAVQAEAITTPAAVAPAPAPRTDKLTPTPAPRPSAATVETVPDIGPAPARNRQALWIGVVLGGLLLVVGVTLALVLFFATRKGAQDNSVQAATSAEEADSGTSNPPSDDPPRRPLTFGGDAPPPPPDPARRNDPPLMGDPPTLPTSAPEPERVAWLPPEEQERVNKAIDRGVQWLKTHQTPNGTWGGRVGLAALPALTLLECGVPADDIRVQKAAHHVRKAVPNLFPTYDLALVILFLDRLGDPADEKLIQTCALRLVAGQTAAGGWTYQCPNFTPAQQADLLLVMEQTRPKSSMDLFVAGPNGSAPPGFIAQDSGSTPDKGLSGDSPESKLLGPGSTSALDQPKSNPEELKKALDRLPPHLRGLPALQPPEKSHKMPPRDISDNSNTQFAILGLSAAQRHKLPLERSLALIVRRFRTSEAHKGGWSYQYSVPTPDPAVTHSMTGAGLLGLAVGLGLAADHSRPQARGRQADPGIEKAFTVLGQFIDKPPPAKRPRPRGGVRQFGGARLNYYTMWSVERCGVLFNRREIAGKDWYPWGAELLVDNQGADGTWSGGTYPAAIPIADTCFALLFLRRANLAKDLTKKLEFFMEGKNLQGP